MRASFSGVAAGVFVISLLSVAVGCGDGGGLAGGGGGKGGKGGATGRGGASGGRGGTAGGSAGSGGAVGGTGGGGTAGSGGAAGAVAGTNGSTAGSSGAGTGGRAGAAGGSGGSSGASGGGGATAGTVGSAGAGGGAAGTGGGAPGGAAGRRGGAGGSGGSAIGGGGAGGAAGSAAGRGGGAGTGSGGAAGASVWRLEYATTFTAATNFDVRITKLGPGDQSIAAIKFRYYFLDESGGTTTTLIDAAKWTVYIANNTVIDIRSNGCKVSTSIRVPPVVSYTDVGCDFATPMSMNDSLSFTVHDAATQNPTNDYSYLAGGALAANTHMLITLNGTVVWGTPPP